MDNTLLGLPVEIWALGCFAVAVVYAYLWPRPPRAKQRSPWEHFVLRWLHALTWLWLGLAALSVKYVGPTAAQFLGLLSLASYITFMVTLVREKFRYPTG
jgi:hypothetical protein